MSLAKMFRIEIYSKHDNKSSELQELDPRKKKQLKLISKCNTFYNDDDHA